MQKGHFEAVPGESPGCVRLVGELDLANVLALRAAMEAAPPDSLLTLDFGDLTYIDSSGLHAIVQCAKALNGRAPLRLVNASEHILRVLEIVGLDHHPNIAIERADDGK